MITEKIRVWPLAHNISLRTQVAWLLSLEACDPSVRTALGETALHLSAVRGDERMCQTLIEGGCSPEAVTREGKTALHLAAGMGERNDGETFTHALFNPSVTTQ